MIINIIMVVCLAWFWPYEPQVTAISLMQSSSDFDPSAFDYSTNTAHWPFWKSSSPQKPILSSIQRDQPDVCGIAIIKFREQQLRPNWSSHIGSEAPFKDMLLQTKSKQNYITWMQTMILIMCQIWSRLIPKQHFLSTMGFQASTRLAFRSKKNVPWNTVHTFRMRNQTTGK